jgi:DNA-binding transcriptional LysR family regulator
VIVNEFGVIRALVAQSDAIGFVPGEAVRGEIERGEFKELRLAPNQRELLMVPILIATLKDRALPPAALALMTELEAVIDAAGHRR